MKKILIKVSLFLILLFVINGIIRKSVPFWWGNPGFVEKYDYLKDNRENYNMVFLGSSRIYRHVIPSVLDKRMRKYNIKSFNMAYAATANPELFYLTEKLISEDWFKFEYVVVELGNYRTIDDGNFHSSRVKYHMNLESLFLTLKSLKVENKLNFDQFYKHLVSYIEYSFNFGLIDEIIEFKIGERGNENTDKLKQYAGYKRFNENKGSDDYKNRHVPFLKRGVKKLQNRSKKVHKAFIKYKNDTTIYNQAYFNKVNELIEIAEKKGIHIIFIVPVRAKSGKIVLTTANNLNEENRIIIYDSKEYPEFYNVKNSFDLGHLNRRGTKKFTNVLAKEIKQKLKKNNSSK